jgi:hypothetical protein
MDHFARRQYAIAMDTLHTMDKVRRGVDEGREQIDIADAVLDAIEAARTRRLRKDVSIN